MAIVLLHHAKRKSPCLLPPRGNATVAALPRSKPTRRKAFTSIESHGIGALRIARAVFSFRSVRQKGKKGHSQGTSFSKDEIFTKKVKAEYLFRKGYVKKAREIWEENIERGDIESLLALGISYRTGKRKERDYQKAFLLLRRPQEKAIS